jgi:histidyl-tRNA synthetase
MPDPILRLKGTYDILPAESGQWQWLEDIVRLQMQLFNYGEMRTPVFERTEVFSRGIGDETDIVKKEMYTFADLSGKSLTLKPEMTAAIMRAYLQNNLQAIAPLQKVYYIAPMFRQGESPGWKAEAISPVWCRGDWFAGSRARCRSDNPCHAYYFRPGA